MAQLNHYNTPFTSKQFPITLLCDNVTNAPNLGSLFRLCDAMGIEKLILSGNVMLGKKMAKTARATEKAVDFEIVSSLKEVVNEFKNTHTIYSLEIASNSKPLHSTSFNKTKPIALVIGAENFGVSEEVLNLCDEIIHINMYGQNSSMNVVQATAMTLYEITKQLL